MKSSGDGIIGGLADVLSVDKTTRDAMKNVKEKIYKTFIEGKGGILSTEQTAWAKLTASQ
jgi:hypothetical protein